MNLRHAYIIDGKRSYIGVTDGMYKNIPAEILGARVLCATVEPELRDNIDYIIAGNGVGAGGNICRLMMLEAGFSDSIPAYTIDLQCGSGLTAIEAAYEKIACGKADYIIAGGFESSSTAPLRAYNKNHPDYEYYGGEDSTYSVAKFSPGYHDRYAMIKGAERVAIADNISREALNKWVLRSHRLAGKARDVGKFKDILVQVSDGMCKDSGIRDRINDKFLDKLPCLLPDGKVMTAGNTCLTHDGAAYVRVASERYIEDVGVKPLAEIVDMVAVGGNPLESPRTAITAIEKLLLRNNMTWKDISVFECNEAFAVIDELFARKYPNAVDRYNVYGGALAYGHPYGASGGIITLHACMALEELGGEYAVCSIAAAGGVGQAMLIKNVK